ncbi:MAG: MBL fold metallo-hydrolase [Pseudomonadales bacterium]
MRRWFWTLMTALVVGAALAYAYGGELALRLMSRAVSSNMATDALAALPDGLHLAVCGAGAPLPDSERSGPCLAVIAGGTLLAFDAGTGGARNLQRMGFPPGRLGALFVTHFHSDHIDGLGEMAMLRWTGGSHLGPLPVHGPTGIGQVVEGFNLAYAQDAAYRTAHHGAEVAPPSGAGAVAVAFEPPAPGTRVTVWREGELSVSAFSVDHTPVVPAVGYRVDYRGRSLVISGDTVATDDVRRAAEGVDLLAHEALSPRLVGVLNRAAVDAGASSVAKITLDILDYHTTPVEAAELAAAAGARHLLLYHVVPPLPLPGLARVFLDGVSDAYDGPVTLARDGLLISLPAGSDEVSVQRRL